MSEKTIAACGFDCATCPAFIATKNNDDELRKQIADKWNIQFAKHDANFAPEEINCVGCRIEGVHINYCAICAVKQCVLTKRVEHCLVCSEINDCDIRKKFEQEIKELEENR